MICLAWDSPDAIFDEKKHDQPAEELLSFRLVHQVNQFPTLEIEVLHLDQNVLRTPQKIFLSVRDETGLHLIFSADTKDNLWGEQTGESWSYRIEARPINWKDQVQEKIEVLLKHAAWDPLFAWGWDAESLPKFLLDTTDHQLHWDRLSQSVRLVKRLEGHGPFQEISDYFSDGLSFTEKKSMPSIRVQTSVQWVQTTQGLVDLSTSFQNYETHGYISTLTPDFVMKNWWKPGTHLRNTGYTLLKSHLTPVTQLETGPLNLFPQKSTVFETQEGEKTVKRHWFKPTLIAHWKRIQKRQEFLSFILSESGGQENDFSQEPFVYTVPLGQLVGEETEKWQSFIWYEKGARVVHGDILYESAQAHRANESFQQELWKKKKERPLPLRLDFDQFFKTERGKNLMHAVMDRAACFYRRQQGTNQLHLEVLPKNVLSLDLGKCLKASYAGKDFLGRVSGYTLSSDGAGFIKGTVTLSEIEEKEPILKVGKGGQNQTALGVTYGALCDHRSEKETENSNTFDSVNFVQDATIENHADQQNILLKEKVWSSDKQAQAFLKKNPTRLRLALRSLSGKDCIEKHVSLP